MFQGSFSNLDTSPYSEDFEEAEVMDLHKACRLGDLSAIKQAFRAQPEKLNERDAALGWAPLYRAVICGYAQAADFLLQQGADPNITNNVISMQLGQTPLHQAADNSHTAIAELLLQHGANPNAQQSNGDTPLHQAAYHGELSIVEVLLRHRADPNIQNFTKGRTPLHCAVSAGHIACVRCLLAGGADMDIADKKQKTVFDLAGTMELQELLIQLYKYRTSELEDEDESPASRAAITKKQVHMLSPITEVISFNQSDLEEDLELSVSISPPRTNKSSPSSNRKKMTYEVERSPKPRLSMGLKPLFAWLEKENLQDLYEVLVEAGYDDIEEMVQQMKSPLPITEDSLRNIGVSKPGHRYRLLMRLEEESGLKPAFPRRQPGSQRSKPFLQCCAVPTNTTFGVANAQSVSDWLSELKLDHLYTNFKDAGFDDYEALVCQVTWTKPITEELLEKEVRVMKPGHRSRILSKLKEDALSRERAEGTVIVESNEKLVACEMCRLM